MNLIVPLFLLLLVIGTPIAIVLLAASFLVISLDPFMGPGVMVRAFHSFLTNYTLMAIPLFILAGFLMERTGMIAQLFRFADAAVGWIPGGFGFATLLAAVIFAAMSGSMLASAALLAGIAVPEMLRRGYPAWFAAGIVTSAGGIAILIPPSVSLIVYGVVSETSITELFLAGIIPGLLLAVSDAVVIAIVAWKLKLPRGERFRAGLLARETVKSLPTLLMPVVVLGGLYGGVFTPTEAGAVACAYAIVYGLFARPKHFLKGFLMTAQRTLSIVAAVMLIMGAVGVFVFVSNREFWPQVALQAVVGWGIGPTSFVIGMMGLGLILGMFLDGIAMIAVTTPIVVPIAESLGIGRIHWGIIFVLNTEFGALTPPVGMTPFAVALMGRVPLMQVYKGSVPFFFTDLMVLILLIIEPRLATWLPDLLSRPIFG